MKNDNYLAHHGIKNQRWGVQHGPPYPVRRGAGGKPKTTSIVKSKLSEAMAKRKDVRATKKAESAAERHEQLKKDVVANPKKIYKYRDMFSKEEIDDMIKQIEFNRKIQDIRNTEIQRGIDAFKRAQSVTQTMAGFAQNGQVIYNFAANLNNALIDSGRSNGKKWTVLGQKSNEQDKKPNN